MWISTEDERPPVVDGRESDEVLCCTSSGVRPLVYDHEDVSWVCRYTGKRLSLDEVTHWRVTSFPNDVIEHDMRAFSAQPAGVRAALLWFADELIRAQKKYAPMAGPIEGARTIKCEYTELERETDGERKDYQAMKKEVVQVGAMALRFCLDVLP